jgi:cell division control protein 6
VKSAIRQAYTEVEGETLKSLSYRDLIILQALFKNPDTNTAYTEVSRHPYFSGSPPSKSTFFQGVNYLQSLGLITLIKKKATRAYTMEVQSLRRSPDVTRAELKRSLAEATL